MTCAAGAPAATRNITQQKNMKLLFQSENRSWRGTVRWSRLAFMASAMLTWLLTSSASAQTAAKAPPRQYPVGSVKQADHLPPGRFRTELEKLSPGAKARALEVLERTHFTELDLDSLHVDNNGAVSYACAFTPPPDVNGPVPDGSEPPVVAEAPLPLSPFPSSLIFHSRPGSANVLYIDFNGETVTGTDWNTSLGRAVIPARPFSMDTNYTSFSDAEQSLIKQVWHRVAEDYAPFDIDVTTERPLFMTTRTAHALVTANFDALGNPNPAYTAGGVAFLNVFGSPTYAQSRPAWIYHNQEGDIPGDVAEALSHEIGHNMGLSHDGLSDGTEYYGGHGNNEISWGPLMGTGYGRNVSQWSKGDYYLANNSQDDLAVISGKLTYRVDDHSNFIEGATELDLAGSTNIFSTTPEIDPGNTDRANKGVIERNTDVDVFTFINGPGTIRIAANPLIMSPGTYGGNLDIRLELYTESGFLVAFSNPTNLTTALLQTNVPAGRYYLAVRGSGAGNPLVNPPLGYSAYGSIGQYFLSGYVTALPGYVPPSPPRMLQLTANPPSGSFVLAGSTQSVAIALNYGLSTATVTGQISGGGALDFKNDGLPPDAAAGDAVYSANLAVPASTNPISILVSASATNRVSNSRRLDYIVVPPPLNDNFNKSTKVAVAGDSYQTVNRFATIEFAEPQHGGYPQVAGSLWWDLTLPQTTQVLVDTAGSWVNTVVGVYTGNALANLTEAQSSNIYVLRPQAAMFFTAQAGVTYRIAVASPTTSDLGGIQVRIAPNGQLDSAAPVVFFTSPLNGAVVTTNVIVVSGTAADSNPNGTGLREIPITVNDGPAIPASGTSAWFAQAALKPGVNTITARAVDGTGNSSGAALLQVNYVVPRPTNDYFANALPLAGDVAVQSAFTYSATAEVGEPNHAGIAGGKSVWWKFSPAQDGQLVLSTEGSSFDTLLAVYTGNSLSTLVPVAANDDAFLGAPGGYSQVVLGVYASQVYYIALDGYGGASGSAVLSNSYTPTVVYHVEVSAGTGGTVTPGSTDAANNSTIVFTAEPAQGYLFDKWEGSVTSLSNPLSLTVTNNMTLTAIFRPVSYTDGFESGDFSFIGWTSGGNLPWLVRTNVVAAGQFAARSGFISHAQTSSLIYSGSFQTGEVTFAYKVSSEPNFDWLRFVVDGIVRQQWSGEVGWASHAHPLTAGDHTLEWRYVKDASLSAGADAAYLDNVNLPLVVSDSAVFRARLSIEQTSEGTTYVDLTGQPGQTYVFQASADMVSWDSFSTNVAVGGFARAVDAASASKPRHYYRAIIPRP